MRVMTVNSLWGQDVYVHPSDCIEIPEAIDKGTNTGSVATTEDGLQTPLPLIRVAGRRNDPLELVVDLVEGASRPRVVVIERQESGHFTGDRVESRVGLDILAHRLSDCSRPGVESLVFPGVVELLEQIVGDVETGAHTVSFATVLVIACYYVRPAVVLTTFLSSAPLQSPAMCHHFESVDELTDQERAELVEEHDLEELRAEHSEEELETLGIA